MLATGDFRIGLVREPTTGQQMKILTTLKLTLLLLVVLPSLGEAAGCLGRLTLEQHQACQALRAHNARQAIRAQSAQQESKGRAAVSEAYPRSPAERAMQKRTSKLKRRRIQVEAGAWGRAPALADQQMRIRQLQRRRSGPNRARDAANAAAAGVAAGFW
jgi:hypothetical protein